MSGPLKILFLCLFLTVCAPARAGEGGQVILDLQEEAKPYNLREEYEKYWQDVDFFDKKYAGSQIEEDFTDDVIERHPEYAEESSALRERFLRNTVKVRRAYNSLKAQVREFLLKQEVPLVAADDQYEFGEPEVYRPSAEAGKALVIKDFKKIIAYSDNPREQAAAAAKLARDAGLPDSEDAMQKMKQALLKRDWKTVFTYGLFDGKNTLDDMRGIGEWSGDRQKLRARIVNSLKVVNGREEVSGAVQIQIPDQAFVLLQEYKGHRPLRIKIAQSANLGDVGFNLPLPYRFFSGPDSLVGYAGLVTVPFSARVQDTAQPFSLTVEISADVCRDDKCSSVVLKPRLEIAAGTETDAESAVASFLRLIRPYYPQPSRDDIRIISFAAEPDAGGGQVLRLELETSKKPSRVDVFVEGAEASEFAPPLVRVDGRRIVVRFRALDDKADYVGRQLGILAAASPQVVLRQRVTVAEPSLFDTESPRLSLMIVWFAFVGGLFLNFMPCVFPVLSLKILSFTRFGAVRPERIRRDFVYNLLGIFCSFAVLIGVLIALKQLGYALGWGMQFQSVWFISFMTFVIALFLAQVMGLVNLRVPDFIQKLADRRDRGEKAVQFFSGMFLVLLSTPCTAPYLGTALGFALAGSVSDIIIVVGMVGLGLATPYILVALVPDLAYYVPKPGKWMTWFNAAVLAMLLLTLGWLLSLLAAQGGSALLWHYLLFVPALWLVLFIRKALIEELERQEDDPQVFLTIRRAFNLITLAVLAAVVVWGMTDAQNAVKRQDSVKAPLVSEKIDRRQIDELVRGGNVVLLKIGADWCLTCHYNDAMVLDTPFSEEMYRKYNIVPIEIDWSRYDADILAFMEKYGRKGLPFYVLFSTRVPDGMVLPEILNEKDFEEIVRNQAY